MNDRGMKKWKPFNAVVSSKELLNGEEYLLLPELSECEIMEYEEILVISMYTHSKVKIIYIENGQKKEITDYVINFDTIKKNIYLNSKTINFRQICKVEK